MRRTWAAYVVAAAIGLGWALTAQAQNAGGAAKPAPSGIGLDSLNDDKLMAELAARGLNDLLERAFEINNVPAEQREGFIAQRSLKELIEKQDLSPSRRARLIKDALGGLVKALPTMKDPEQLMQLAAVFIRFGAERDVNTLEYWGDNPKTQAELRPVAEAIDQILDRCAVEAERKATDIANRMTTNAPQSLVDQWMKFDNLTTNAKYTKEMSAYYRAMSYERADSKRQEIAQQAIDYLQQWDNPESQVQPTVRNRLGKLNLVKGDYARSIELFSSVANPPTDMRPQPTDAQRYEARYFGAVAALDKRDLTAATKARDELESWQKRTFAGADNEAALKGAQAALSMLDYRLEQAKAEATSDPKTKEAANKRAVAVLLQLVKDRPELEGIIFEQLLAVTPANPDLKGADPLMLRAMLYKGDRERQLPDDQKPDEKTIDQAIAAAKELITRPGVANELVDTAAILIPAMLERVGRLAEAGSAYLDYIEKYSKNHQRAEAALEAARVIIGELRRSTPKDPATLTLYERFLPIALNKPFLRKEFAFEYARRLQSKQQYAEAVKYFRMVPADDRLSLDARFGELVSLNAMLADSKLPKSERQKIVADIRKLFDVVNRQAEQAATNAGTEQERNRFQALHVKMTLIAADIAQTEEKNPKRTLELLNDFEQSVQGLPGARDLVSEALFLRVNAHTTLGQNAEATRSLLRYIEGKPANEVADMIYGLLKKLDDDFDEAIAADDMDRARSLARARADLTPHLVEWARNSTDPKVRDSAYQYMVFDAATKKQAAELETDPAKRQAMLNEAFSAFKSLESPANHKLYMQANQGKPNFDPRVADPAVRQGIGLVGFALGDYKTSQEYLGRLLNEKRLGTPKSLIERDGEWVEVDNDQYWEAQYKLMKSNAELYKADPQNAQNQEAMDATKRGLKRLLIQWGPKQIGGAKWNEKFASLQREIIPTFDPNNIIPDPEAATAPAK